MCVAHSKQADKAKVPLVPGSSTVPATLSGNLMPNAASSPKEEPDDQEDSVNGAAKRPHSPLQEDVAKRHKDTEVRLPEHVCSLKIFTIMILPLLAGCPQWWFNIQGTITTIVRHSTRKTCDGRYFLLFAFICFLPPIRFDIILPVHH